MPLFSGLPATIFVRDGHLWPRLLNKPNLGEDAITTPGEASDGIVRSLACLEVPKRLLRTFGPHVLSFAAVDIAISRKETKRCEVSYGT